MAVPTESEVATTEAPEGAPSIEEAPEGAEAVKTPEEVTEPKKEAEEPDPLVELRERLTEFERTYATKAELHPLASNLGRVDGIQSALDEAAKADPLAAVDPRLTAIENLNIANATALLGLGDEQVSTAEKAALRSSLVEIDTARTQRSQDVAIATAKTELRAELQPPEDTEEVEAKPVRTPETIEVAGYAEGKGVDFASIPTTAWRLAEGETMQQAIARVKSVVDSLAEEAASPERVATRRQAAGSGTPSRSGAAMNDLQLIEDYGSNPEKYPSKADRERVFAAMEREDI